MATIKTVFTHKTKTGTWYIDHNDDPQVKYPYAVSKDGDYVCSRKELDEAVDAVITMCNDSILIN